MGRRVRGRAEIPEIGARPGDRIVLTPSSPQHTCYLVRDLGDAADRWAVGGACRLEFTRPPLPPRVASESGAHLDTAAVRLEAAEALIQEALPLCVAGSGDARSRHQVDPIWGAKSSGISFRGRARGCPPGVPVGGGRKDSVSRRRWYSRLVMRRPPPRIPPSSEVGEDPTASDSRRGTRIPKRRPWRVSSLNPSAGARLLRSPARAPWSPRRSPPYVRFRRTEAVRLGGSPAPPRTLRVDHQRSQGCGCTLP